jgi:alkaline phosphatase
MCFIPEVLDLDNAVKVAYEFYQQHPDETLIVVTADHETGGLTLGRGPYELHLEVVGNQRMSIEKLGKELHALHEKHGDKYSWDIVKAFLTENFGFWSTVKLKDDQTKRLEKAFQNIMSGKGQDTKSLYQKDDELATTVRKIQAECAMTGWQSGGHSNGYVPCFAIGAGAELFTGRIDNTEIPKRIAKAAGWQIK